ncbi:MAG: DNA methyltransferase [Myxococcota bacterium]|nr:DNA methyltransferase [Myxococcota bacterium]
MLTTQPGWAFATLAELRSRGVTEIVPFHHRDSTIVVTDQDSIGPWKLTTVAEAFGGVAISEPFAEEDATATLVKQLSSDNFKDAIMSWLPRTTAGRLRRFSVSVESYGRAEFTRMHLDDVVEAAIQEVFPRWRRGGTGSLRFYCKTDPAMSFVGVQIYAGVGSESDRLPGALRSHLAAGLLSLADVRPGDTVLDPFMGSGTILHIAATSFEASKAIGVEIDPETFGIAQNRMVDRNASLTLGSFEDIDLKNIPPGTKLVGNVPFGNRFASVRTDSLVELVGRVTREKTPFALLLDRGQAQVLASQVRCRTKNVLVLGRPAAIAYITPWL